MKMKKHILTAIILSLAFAGQASAQHPMILQRLTEWNAAAPAPSSQVILAEIEFAAARINNDSGKCAQSPLTVEQVSPATADRYVFQGIINKQIKNGWTAKVNQPKCSAEEQRYMIIQTVNDELRTFRVNRGVSYAHESLIGDTLPIAMIAAKVAFDRLKMKCEVQSQAKLGVIRLGLKESDLGSDVFGVRYSGSWNEVWPVTMCSETVEVPIRFTADGDGGATYNIKGESVKLITPSTK